MFKWQVLVSRSVVPQMFFFGLAAALSCVTSAAGLKPQLKKDVTCYAMESISNDFVLVRMNLENHSVVATVYGSDHGDMLTAREMVEYSDTMIGNMEKAGSCYPVMETEEAGLAKVVRFADSCTVKDTSSLVTSVGVKYKMDVINRSGSMNVKSYFFDGAVFSERNYTFYSCF